MADVRGAGSFAVSGDAYDAFMGRYSRPLASDFATFAGAAMGQRALDVGCGPGALTGELVRILGAGNVATCDPSPPFVADCARRNPGVDVRRGSAENVPFDADAFDLATAQLVLHFVSDPPRAASELCRVMRPGGVIAACVWDFDQGMELLRAFWDAALSLDPEAPDEARVLRFGKPGEIAGWLSAAGLHQISETTLTVASDYRDFDELWASLLAGIGPAGSYCAGLPDALRADLREALFGRLGRPGGGFRLTAVARAARGVLRTEPDA